MGEEVMNKSTKMMDIGSFVKMGGSLLVFLGFLAGIFVYLDNTYVRSDIYRGDIAHIVDDMTALEDKTARLIEVIEEDREYDQNEIMKAIKDSTAFTLVVRRDVLLAQGDLSPHERAELNVLNQKLQELNVD